MNRVMKPKRFPGTRHPNIGLSEVLNRAEARIAAGEGIVLLKNEENILPLRKGSRIALYGGGAVKTIKGGTGSGDVNERSSVSIYEGLLEAGFDITTRDWLDVYSAKYDEARLGWRDEILEKAKTERFFKAYTETVFEMPEGGPVSSSVNGADIAVFVLSRVAGEGADRYEKKGDYYLSDHEYKLLSDICALYKHVIVILNTGGQVDLGFMDEFANIKGLIQAGQCGMEGGHAIADIISGDVNPSGKLTDSWAFKYEDYPNAKNFSHNNGNVEQEVYNEGIYVGYRYFDSFEIPVRYGFGFGLSYTTFDISFMSAAWSSHDSSLYITVKVKNTGTVRGKEVVQFYVSLPRGQLEKEYRRLAGFVKSKDLEPGAEEIRKFRVPIRNLASYSETVPGWVLEAGMYGLWVGNSLEASSLQAGITLERDVVLTKTQNLMVPGQEFEEFSLSADEIEARNEDLVNIIMDRGLPIVDMDPEDVKTVEVEYKANRELTDPEPRAFVDELGTEKLIALASGDPGKGQGNDLGSAGIMVPGSAGETSSCAGDQNLANIVLADGPAGLRLWQYYYVLDGDIVNMPFEFSLEKGLFYPEAENLKGDKYYQYCTAIPVGTVLAQTWNPHLLEGIGEMIGSEMCLLGITLWLAPGMCIHRNPLCGRNFEYFSEDPLITGVMAAAITRGVQRNPGCGTTIKHFACNNQEDNRMGSDSILSERALREIYLRGFETAIEIEQPMAIMTSYNLINGVHAANNADLCTGVARNEWGFKGLIMTDWTTTMHGPDCTASGCMRAGNDLIMPGAFSDRDNLLEELEAGTLDIEDLKACVSRTVQIIWKSNRYEDARAYHVE